MAVYIGLDIGGTKFMVAAADGEGNILRRQRAATPEGLEEGIELLHEMAGELAEGEDILGMGAAIGGPLDWEKGIVSPLHQPQWREVPLKERMEKRWGCRFSVDVDTNVAAFGEYHRSEDKPESLLYITMSTGMGGGFIVDGKIYRGKDGGHPEVGHQSIPYKCMHPERVKCDCGLPDCLEALVSGSGIRRVYGKPAEELTEAEWEEVAWNLGLGLRNIAAIALPEVIVLGGGVAVGGSPKLIGRAREVMAEHLRIVPVPEVRLSALGYDTALCGAVEAAIRGLD